MGAKRYTEAEVLEALDKCEGLVYLVRQTLDISEDTWRRYRQAWKSIRDRQKEWNGRNLDTAENRLMKAVKAGKPWAVCFFLKTRGKDRGYVERTEQREVTPKKVLVKHDKDFFGNGRAAGANGTPIADPVLTSKVQSACVRPEVGQNGCGANGRH